MKKGTMKSHFPWEGKCFSLRDSVQSQIKFAAVMKKYTDTTIQNSWLL